MVQFKNNELIITVERSSVEDVLNFQSALVAALVQFNQSKDNHFCDESFFIGLLLSSLQPDYDTMATALKDTCENSYFKTNKPLTQSQKMQTLELINSFI